MAKPKTIKILFTGGGTSGHFIPIIAVARELQRLYIKPDLELHYAGPRDEASALQMAHENIKTHNLIAGKIRRYFSLQNIVDIVFKIPFSFAQSFWLVAIIDPQLVFSKGGTGAVPVCLWAWLLGIPVFFHESDSVPGLSNRVVYRWAKKAFISFEKTAYFDLSKAILVGNLVKKELAEGSPETARELLHITFEKPVVLFLGGSQGAQPINDFLMVALPELLPKYEIIHVCGSKNFQQVQLESQVVVPEELAQYYHVYGSLNETELKHAYKAAGLAVSRAGAGSIFELALCGKPALLVPLPQAASDHQSKNAYEYAATGAAEVVEQENLMPHFLVGKLDYYFSRPELLQNMADAALRFSKPLAAKAIAREILEYLNVNEEKN